MDQMKFDNSDPEDREMGPAGMFSQSVEGWSNDNKKNRERKGGRERNS